MTSIADQILKKQDDDAQKKHEENIKKWEGIVQEIVDLLKTKELSMAEAQKILQACATTLSNKIGEQRFTDLFTDV